MNSGHQKTLKSLGAQPWMTEAETVKVFEALATEPGMVRFVGGCVRNTLNGEPITDIDLATVHEPPRVIELLEKAGFKAIPTGIDHGTITAVHGKSVFEITTLRKDVATDGRRAVIAYTRNWEEDAERRDFTMNAIYADLDGTLYDPTGGIKDIETRTVRFIGDAHDRIREDYLRILRYFRFHTRYGHSNPDPAALAACTELKGGLKTLSGERIQSEFLKLLEADRAIEGLQVMESAGILVEVLPEAKQLSAVATLIDIETKQLSICDSILRLAALIGPSQDAVSTVCDRLKFSNAARDRLQAIATNELKLTPDLSESKVRQHLYRMGEQLFKDVVLLTWIADKALANEKKWQAQLAVADNWTKPVFPLTGTQVIAAGVEKGPEVGRIMREIETWWVEQDFTPDETMLLERLNSTSATRH